MAAKRSLPLLFGAAMAALTLVADLLLQYTPRVERVGSPDYLYLLDVSRSRLLWGHALGVVAILLMTVGLRAAAGLISGPAWLRRGYEGLAVFSCAGTAVFHALFAPIGLALQTAPDAAGRAALVAALRPAHEMLGTPILLLYFFAATLFTGIVAAGRTPLPRATALATQMPLWLALLVLARTSPLAGTVIFPAGLSLGNTIFFLVLARGARPRPKLQLVN
jgi:hypothetical protein